MLIYYTDVTTSEAKDDEGFLKDLDGLDDIGDIPGPGKIMDIDNFFEKALYGDDHKMRRKCKICKYVMIYYYLFAYQLISLFRNAIVNHGSTLRRHLQGLHKESKFFILCFAILLIYPPGSLY